MLSMILAPIVRFALWIYFRRIDIHGLSLVPQDRPLIFVANHPNVLLDTLLLTKAIPGHKPRFLAKSTLFKRRIYAFFMKALGAIPVSRQQDGTRSNNADMFRQACAALSAGDCLALYPEGGSQAGRHVRRLKQGAARIGLRAAQDDADVHIVPIGLTYSTPDLFRGEIEIHFGPAIAVADFLTIDKKSSPQAATALTKVIHAHLKALTWHVDLPALKQSIEDANLLYGEHLANQLPIEPHLSPRLRASQLLIEAAHHFARTDPDLLRHLSLRLRAYHRKIRRMDIELSARATKPLLRPWMALALAPPAFYGLLHNALPYVLPKLCARPYSRQPEMISTVKFAIGAAVFPLYYLLRTGLSSLAWGWPPALFYGLTLPASGLLALYYKERILATWPLWRLWAKPQRRRAYLNRLAAERLSLLAQLDRLKDRYLTEARI